MLASPFEEIRKAFQALGCTTAQDWIDVSERPGRPAFAKELNYNCNDIWGKVHVRREGDVYVLVISKDVFNWKDRVKDLSLNSEVVDAAGGLMWVYVKDVSKLRDDVSFLLNYVRNLKVKK